MPTDRRRGVPRFSCLLRAIFLLIGVPSLLLAAVGYIALSGRAEFANNHLGTGTLIDVKNATASCPYYIVSFTSDRGQRVTFEAQLCSGAHLGQSVQVMYDPRNPTLAPTVVDLSDSARYRVGTYAIAGVAFTFLGLFPLRSEPDDARPLAKP